MNKNNLHLYEEKGASTITYLLCIHLAITLFQFAFLGFFTRSLERTIFLKVFQVLATLIPVAIYRLRGGNLEIRRRLRINCMPVVAMYFIGLALMCGALLLNERLCDILVSFGANITGGTLALYTTPKGIVFCIGAYVIIPAICEELFFRYALLKSLGGGLYAVIISAVCFSLMHFDIYGSFYTFGAGLVLAIAAIATGSLWLSFALHISMNGIALYLAYMEKLATKATYGLVSSVIWAAVFIAGIVFAVYSLLNYSRQQNNRKAGEENDGLSPRKNNILILAPVIYIAVLVIWNLIKMVL
ncbi:MAG: CPBP family intramembrane metalloprotease [Clostridia bacterium]|nr:CPBP family intramembrane metalloprotease [Clostridia bacterium]